LIDFEITETHSTTGESYSLLVRTDERVERQQKKHEQKKGAHTHTNAHRHTHTHTHTWKYYPFSDQ